MLSWFQPVCPVDPIAKIWVEGRLRWLSEQFGDGLFLRRPLVLPTTAHFPELVLGKDSSLQALFERVCDWMDVDSDRIELEIGRRRPELELHDFAGETVSETAGGWWVDDLGRERITLDPDQFGDPLHLIGTIAHELCHSKLIGAGKITGDELDNELLTDLCVVHHGLGIFLANAPRAWRSDCTCWPGTKLLKPEYMTANMYGWALAHQAWLRGEARPAWLKFLRSDARSCTKHGLRFLDRTRDSAFRSNDWTNWDILCGTLTADA